MSSGRCGMTSPIILGVWRRMSSYCEARTLARPGQKQIWLIKETKTCIQFRLCRVVHQTLGYMQTLTVMTFKNCRAKSGHLTPDDSREPLKLITMAHVLAEDVHSTYMHILPYTYLFDNCLPYPLICSVIFFQHPQKTPASLTSLDRDPSLILTKFSDSHPSFP